MNGKERIVCALSLGCPDTVPVWELAFNEESIIKLARRFMDERELPPAKNVVDMSEREVLQLVNAFRVMGENLGLDGLTATSSAPRQRIDGEHYRDGWGVVYHQSDKGEPYPVQGPIREPSDLKHFAMRMPEESDFIMIDLMKANFPDRAVAYILNGPFYMSRCLRGSLENLLMDYILNPGLAADLARICTDHNLAALEIIAKKGADFVVSDCDLAFNHSTMMSPDQYDRFLHPYHQEIVKRGHELGIKMVKHTDGKIQPLIPRFIAEGFDGLHPLQPQCLEIKWVKQEYGKRICLMGNIDCMYLLVFGTAEEVRRKVKETIAAAAPGGGYIISSSNTLHPGVKPENYMAMVRAAREFGKYPD